MESGYLRITTNLYGLGITDGDKLPHTWENATCTTPKICSVCKANEGNALGHNWNDATCTTPKTCKICGLTEGDPLGHNVLEQTCTNDAICDRCGEVLPAVGHTYTEATCTEPAKCTKCGEEKGEPLGHTSSTGVCARCGYEVYTTVSGWGDDVVSDITIGTGIYRIHFVHIGSRNFIVHSYDSSNKKNLLINEISYYDGSVYLQGTSPFAIEIKADGSWSYTIEKLIDTVDKSFVGHGDYVTNLCDISSGAWEFTHDGKSNFIVYLYTTNGRDLLINEIGIYKGKKMLTIPNGNKAFFVIKADGNWSIKKA